MYFFRHKPGWLNDESVLNNTEPDAADNMNVPV